MAGLESAASDKPAPPSEEAVVAVTLASPRLFTPDQLAARTPKNYPHAMSGPDKDYWVPGAKKDFAMIRGVSTERGPARGPR